MRNYKYDWENPAIIKKNKEDGHVIAFSYDNEADALNRVEPKTKMTLNGTWKFHWQRGLGNCPTDFYKDSFDTSYWRDIKVPSVWQIGQDTESYPYYYASTYCRAISRSKNKIPSIDHTMQEIGIYVRDFDMPESFDGQEIFCQLTPDNIGTVLIQPGNAPGVEGLQAVDTLVGIQHPAGSFCQGSLVAVFRLQLHDHGGFSVKQFQPAAFGKIRQEFGDIGFYGSHQLHWIECRILAADNRIQHNLHLGGSHTQTFSRAWGETAKQRRDTQTNNNTQSHSIRIYM